MIVFGMMRKESFLSSLGSLCCFLSRERVKNILGGVSFFYNIYFAFTWKYLKCLCDIRFLEVSLWNVISDAFDRKGLTQDTRRLPVVTCNQLSLEVGRASVSLIFIFLCVGI